MNLRSFYINFNSFLDADARWVLYWRIVRLCLRDAFKDQMKKMPQELESCCNDLSDALLIHCERPDPVLRQWRRLQLLGRLRTLEPVVGGSASSALKEAARLLLSSKDWTNEKCLQVSLAIKSVSASVNILNQEDSDDVFRLQRRLSLESGLNWTKCRSCHCVYQSNSFCSCL